MNPLNNRTLACLVLFGLSAFQAACTSTPEKTLTAPTPPASTKLNSSPVGTVASPLPAVSQVPDIGAVSAVPNDPVASLPTAKAVCSGDDRDLSPSVMSWLKAASQNGSLSFRWVSDKPLDIGGPRGASAAALPLGPGQAMGVVLLNCAGQTGATKKYLYWFMPETQSAELQRWLMGIKSAQGDSALPLQIFPALQQGWAISAKFPKLISEVVGEKNTAEQGSQVYFLPGIARKNMSLDVEALQTIVPSLRFFEFPRTVALINSPALKSYGDSYLYASVPLVTPLGIKRVFEPAKAIKSALNGSLYVARLCGYRMAEKEIADGGCGNAEELKNLRSVSGAASVLSKGVDAGQYQDQIPTLVDSRAYLFGWVSIRSILQSKRGDQIQEWTERLETSPNHVAHLLKGAKIDSKILELVTASNRAVIQHLKSRMSNQGAGIDKFKVTFSLQ